MLVRLSFRYLFKNFARSIILIACIASVFVFLLSRALIEKNSSYNEMLFAQKMYSGYDVSFNNVEKDSVERIGDIDGLKKIVSTDYFGNFSYKNGVSFDLSNFNEEYFKLSRFNLVKGRLPQNRNEIILEKRAAEEMGLNNSLDNTIEFSKIVENDINSKINIDISKKSFKIVGIMDRDRIYYDSAYSLTAFTSDIDISRSNKLDENKKISGFLVFAQNVNPNALYAEVVEKSGLSFNDMRLNDKLTRSKREYKESNSFSNYKEVILICLACILLIFNLFSIFISSYIKEVGELKLIGASKRDVIKVFLSQFSIIWLISIFFGSIIGTIISTVLIKNYIFSNFKEAGFIFEAKDILFPMIVTLGITFLSAIIPIVRYSKKSALECLNISSFGKRCLKSNRLNKRSPFTRNLQGLFTRNLRYLVVSILSFSIMGILFFQMTFRISNDFSVIDMQQNNLFINDMVITPNLVDNNLSMSYFNLDELDKAKGSGKYEMVNYKKEIPYTYLNIDKKNLSEDYYKYNKFQGSSVDSKITFKSYSDNMKESMKEFLRVGSIEKIFDDPELNNEGVVPAIVSDSYYNVETMENSKIFSKEVKLGDIYNVTVNNIKNGKVEKINKKIRVVGILNEDWIFRGNSNFGYSMEVIVSDKNMDRLGLEDKFSQIGFVNKKDSGEDNKRNLEKLFPGDRYSIFDISSYAQRDKINESIYLKEKLSQIIMLFVLAISNMVLMIRASIVKREREFSIMRSIGMSIKEKYRWIISENIVISLIIVMINLIISNYIYYSESKTLNELYIGIFSKPLFDYRIPIIEIIIFTVILFLSVVFGIVFSRDKIKKTEILK